MAAADFKSKTLAGEDIVLLVTSTQGDGEPPEEAVPLYQFLFGKKAPDLSRLSFAVLGLGDSSYPDSLSGRPDFDRRLAELGAKRLLDLGICDLDYQAAADAWIGAAAGALGKLAAAAVAAPYSQTPVAEAAQAYSKAQPFNAVLSLRQKITAREAEKDVRTHRIDLAAGHTLSAGQLIRRMAAQCARFSGQILALHQLAGHEPVRLPDGREHRYSDGLDRARRHHPKRTRAGAAICRLKRQRRAAPNRGKRRRA